MEPTVQCNCCNGTGRRPLSGVYKRTLAVLRRQRDEISGADMARLMGCKNEAMCMRLARLELIGFAESHQGIRDSRMRLWRATKRG